MFLCVHISDTIHLHTSTCYINCSRNCYNMSQVDIWICKNMQKSSNSWPIFIFHMDHTCVQKMVYSEPLLARSEGPVILLAALVHLPAMTVVGWRSWALAKMEMGQLPCQEIAGTLGTQKCHVHFLNIIHNSILFIFIPHIWLNLLNKGHARHQYTQPNFLHNDSCLSQGRKI